MRTISQRELRNDNAAVIRGVEDGETFVVTRHGVPVARLLPIAPESDLRCDRPAARDVAFSAIRRVPPSTSTTVLLEDLRGDG